MIPRQITLLTVGLRVAAGLGADKGIAIARRKAIAGTPPHNSVVVADGEETAMLAGQQPCFGNHLSGP